jgi:hypothetical protein
LVFGGYGGGRRLKIIAEEFWELHGDMQLLFVFDTWMKGRRTNQWIRQIP